MEEKNLEKNNKVAYQYSMGSYSGKLDDTKEVKIDGCNYELSRSEITNWIKQYGKIESNLDKIAISGDTDETLVGTGSYTRNQKS